MPGRFVVPGIPAAWECLGLNPGISGRGIVGFSIDRGSGRSGPARDYDDVRSCGHRGDGIKGATTRRFPEPALRASIPPGPMLLLRDLDFFLFSASVVPAPRSTVALSLSMALVDLRVRRVAGSVVSPAMVIML